jgi:outer membrane receptor for ferrienterochelin and colicin
MLLRNLFKYLFALILFQNFSCADDNSKDPYGLTLAELLELKITTVSLTSQSTITAPGFVKVVTRQQINERGYTNLMEVLRDLPGFQVHDRSDALFHTRYTVRGITGNNKFIILQNGVRISSPIGEFLVVRDNYPLYHIKQIEVVYGPASSLYGADAVSAVVNLVSDDSGSDRNISVDVGEHGYKRVHLNIRMAVGENSSVAIGGHWHENDDHDIVNDNPELYQLSDLVLADGTIVKVANDRKTPEFPLESNSFNLSLQINNFKIDFLHNNEFHVNAIGGKENTVDFDLNPFIENSLDVLSVKYNADISGAIKSTTVLSYSTRELDPNSSFVNAFSTYQKAFSYSSSSLTDFEQRLNFEISHDSTVIAGLKLQWLHAIPFYANLEVPYDADAPPDKQPLFYSNTNRELRIPSFEINYTNQAVFVQWQTNWIETFSSTVGIRAESSSTYGDTIIPRVGMVYVPQKETSIKLLYGEGFLAPSPVQTYQTFGAFRREGKNPDGLYTSDFFFIPNEDLEPEKIRSFEININHQFTEYFYGEISLYHQTLDNLILSVETPTPVVDFIPGGLINLTRNNDNVGKLESEGIDLGINFEFDINTHPVKSWLYYSYVDGELKQFDSTSELPYSANQQVKAGLTYKRNAFTITPSVTWTSAPSLNESGAFEGVESDSYLLSNIYAVWRLTEGLQLHAYINNVFDKRYGSPGASFPTTFISVPQDSRWMRVGFTYRL